MVGTVQRKRKDGQTGERSGKKGLREQERGNQGGIQGKKKICEERLKCFKSTFKKKKNKENSLPFLNNSSFLALFLPGSMKSVSVCLGLGDRGECVRE